MNEEMNAGVEMKVKTPQEVIEETQSGSTSEQVEVLKGRIKELEDQANSTLMETSSKIQALRSEIESLEPGYFDKENQGSSQKVRLKRTEGGLTAVDDESVPEVDTPFALLEPGDDVNHQLVESVEQDEDGNYHVHLDYFGTKTVLNSPNEVFSIFLKEQRSMFKKVITDYVESFKGKFVPEYLLCNTDALLMSLELLCAKVDMSSVDGLIVGNEGVDLALASLLGMTLRKPVYVVSRENKFEPDKQMNVILFTESYVPKAVDDTLEILGNDTKFYISYQLSLFDADYINKYTEAQIVKSEIREDIDRSVDQFILGGVEDGN